MRVSTLVAFVLLFAALLGTVIGTRNHRHGIEDLWQRRQQLPDNASQIRRGSDVDWATQAKLISSTSSEAPQTEFQDIQHSPEGIINSVLSKNSGPFTIELPSASSRQLLATSIVSVSPVYGTVSEGAVITIEGDSLAGVVSATVGSVTATVTSNTAFRVTVQVDPDVAVVGCVDVTLTYNDGPVTAPSQFCWQTPNLELDPTQGPAAGTTTVTIVSSTGGFSDGSDIDSVLFGTFPATNIVQQSSTSITVVAPAVLPPQPSSAPYTVSVHSVSEGTTYSIATSVTGGYYPSPMQPAFDPTTPLEFASQTSGSVVTIMGSDLAGIEAVTLSTIWGSRYTVLTTVFTQIDSETLTFEVPVSTVPGLYNVLSLTTPLNGIISLKNAFVYTVPGFVGVGVLADDLGGVSSQYLLTKGPQNNQFPLIAFCVGLLTFDDQAEVDNVEYISVGAQQASSFIASVDQLNNNYQMIVVQFNATTVTGAQPVTISVIGDTVYTAQMEFTYLPPGSITEVTPSFCLNTGSCQITISGSFTDGLVDPDNSQFSTIHSIIIGNAEEYSQDVVSTSGNETVVLIPDTSVLPAGWNGIEIVSLEYGTVEEPHLLYIGTVPFIESVVPAHGLDVGGYVVTASGVGFGTDPVIVTLDGTVCTVQKQTQEELVILVPPGTVGVTTLIVNVTLYGAISKVDSFTYDSATTISSVTPQTGDTSGYIPVTITAAVGTLGSGTDITSVTIGSVSCDIISQQADSVVVYSPSTLDQGAYPVTVHSVSFGSTTATGLDFDVSYGTGTITALIPTIGAILGNTHVTIVGTNLAFNNDITAVRFGTLDVQEIVSQNVTEVVVVTTASPVEADVQVDVISTTHGTTTSSMTYTYYEALSFVSVTPSNSSVSGGVTVTIMGTALSSNITSVQLVGVEVQQIVSQTTSKMVVVTAATNVAEVGSVFIRSATKGSIVVDGVFTYLTNMTTISSFVYDSPAEGGATITLVGANLDTVNDVSLSTQFGSDYTILHPAFNVIDSSTIEFELPMTPDAGIYRTVSVTTPEYGTVSVTDEFVFRQRGFVALTVMPAELMGTGSIVLRPRGPQSNQFTMAVLCVDLLEFDDSGAVQNVDYAAVGSTEVASFIAGLDATSELRYQLAISLFPPVTYLGAETATLSITGDQIYTSPLAFTYLPTGYVTSVLPLRCEGTGSCNVTISGSFTDGIVDPANPEASTISSLTICNQEFVQSFISTNSTVTIVRIADTSLISGWCDVVVYSLAYGSVSLSDAIFVGPIPTISTMSLSTGGRHAGLPVTIDGASLSSSPGISNVWFGSAAATVVSETDDQVVVTTPVPADLGLQTVIVGAAYSNLTVDSQFTFTRDEEINGIIPTNGPFAGTNQVTILGFWLGDATNDVQSVSLAGVEVGQIVSATTSRVVVQAGAASIATTNVITLTVMSSGYTLSSNSSFQYTYNDEPVVLSVTPNNGPFVGGNSMTVAGINLNYHDEPVSVVICNTAATVLSYSFSEVVVTVPNLSLAGACDVVTSSVSAGTASLNAGYTFNTAPIMSSVTPAQGPFAGQNHVTITGTFFADDLVSVMFGSSAATIVSAMDNTALVTVPAASAAGNVVVTSVSTSFGSATTSYSYNPAGTISSIVPPSGPASGGVTVTITGTNLGDGTDITSVVIGGSSVTEFVSQSSTQIVLVTPISTISGSSSVTVLSVHYGSTVALNAYTSTPGILSSPTSGTLTEGTAQDSIVITYSLTSPPTSSTALTVTTAGRGVITPTTLTFTSSTWNIAQTVTLSLPDDSIDSGVDACVVTATTASDDAAFNGIAVTNTYHCYDNDVAGIEVIASSLTYAASIGAYSVTEGQVYTIQLKLRTQPSGSVVVNLRSSNSQLINAGSTLLTFNYLNWDAPQSISFTAVDDNVVRTLQFVSLFVDSNSPDAKYAHTSVAEMKLVVSDNDQTGLLRVSAADRSALVENGNTTFFVVQMALQTTSDIVVSVAVNDTSEVSVTTNQFTLTPADYLQFRTITIQPEDDYYDDGTQYWQVEITAALMSDPSRTEVYSVTGSTASTRTSGVSLSNSLMVVSQAGDPKTLTITMSSRPFTPVTFTLSASTPNQIQFSPPSWTVDGSLLAWSVPQQVVVSGLRNDANTDDVTVSASLTTASAGNAQYNNLAKTFDVVNKWVTWPGVTKIEPEIISMTATTTVTMDGSNFVDGAEIYLGPSAGARRSYARTLPPFSSMSKLTNVTKVGNSSITGVLPTPATGGYKALYIVNPDGGYYQASDSLYFSENCPSVGVIGTGSNCIPCPVGGYCPGGNRLWPLPGFWTPGEFSGELYQCPVASSCLGGRSSVCAPLYFGERCMSCTSDAYMSSEGTCEQCPGTAITGGLFFIEIVVLIMLMAAVFFAPESWIPRLQFALINLGLFWLITSNGSTLSMPSPVAGIFSVLALFAGDFGFVRPECAGQSGFAVKWGLTVGINLAFVIVLFIATLIRYRLTGNRKDTKLQRIHSAVDNFSPERPSVSKTENLHRNKQLHSVLALLSMMFVVLATYSFEGVFCRSLTPVSASSFAVDPSSVCYQGSASAVHAISYLLIVALCGVAPVLAFFSAKQFSLSRKQERAGSPWYDTVGENLCRMFKAERWWWGPVSVLKIILLVMSHSLLRPVDRLNDIYVKIAIIAVDALAVLILRPFKALYFAVGQVSINVAFLITLISSYLILSDMNVSGGQNLSIFGVVLLLVWVLLAIVLPIVLYCRRGKKKSTVSDFHSVSSAPTLFASPGSELGEDIELAVVNRNAAARKLDMALGAFVDKMVDDRSPMLHLYATASPNPSSTGTPDNVSRLGDVPSPNAASPALDPRVPSSIISTSGRSPAVSTRRSPRPPPRESTPAMELRLPTKAPATLVVEPAGDDDSEIITSASPLLMFQRELTPVADFSITEGEPTVDETTQDHHSDDDSEIPFE